MNVVDLREFYASPLGNTTRRLIANRLKAKTGPLAAATVLGLGYAMPYLEDACAEAGTSLSFMMARQGVIHWPADGSVRSALVDETDLPLLESAVDIIVAVHALELSPSPSTLR